MRILPGDTVAVISGKKDVRGEITSIDHNKVTISTVDEPIDISNVQPVCQSCNRGVRVGVRTLGNGEKERYCKKCGAKI